MPFICAVFKFCNFRCDVRVWNHFLECVSQYESLANECHRIEAKELMYQTLVAELKTLNERLENKFNLVDMYGKISNQYRKQYFEFKKITAKQLGDEMKRISTNLDKLGVDIKDIDESIDMQEKLIKEFPDRAERGKQLNSCYKEIYDVCRQASWLVNTGRVSKESVKTIQVINLEPNNERDRFKKVPFEYIMRWASSKSHYYHPRYGMYRNV